MNKVVEAIKEYWGERCQDKHEYCPCCEAWEEFDALGRKNA